MSKAFKYKKAPGGLTLQTSSSDNLVQQLRTEQTALEKQIAELELKKKCVEDKLREMSLKLNCFYYFSDKENDSGPQFEYRSECHEPMALEAEGIYYSLNDYQAFIPQQSEHKPLKSEPPPQRELFEYFGYKDDLKNELAEMQDLQKLAEIFGLKSNNIPKLKTQLKVIDQYLRKQELPQTWRQLYNADLFNKLYL